MYLSLCQKKDINKQTSLATSYESRFKFKQSFYFPTQKFSLIPTHQIV